MNKNNNKFEHFKKKGVEAYSNIRSLYGKDGEKLLDDVINAFSKAISATEDELKQVMKNKPDLHNAKEKCQKWINDNINKNNSENILDDIINSISDSISNVIGDMFDNIPDEDSKHEETCENKTCKCKGNKHECKSCTCNKKHETTKDPLTIANEADTVINDESPATYLIRQKHQDYINNLSDIIRTKVSPLPSALTRLYRQARHSYKEQHRYEKIALSDVEKKFLTDILNVLFSALDLKFTVNSEQTSNVDDYDDYDDYKLPVFVTNEDEVKEEDNIPTSFDDNTEYWISGIDDNIHMPGIGIRVHFDKYPSEIRHRLISNSDNGRLIELLAIFTSFSAKDITFVNHNNDEGELFFFIDSGDCCNLRDDYSGIEY